MILIYCQRVTFLIAIPSIHICKYKIFFINLSFSKLQSFDVNLHFFISCHQLSTVDVCQRSMLSASKKAALFNTPNLCDAFTFVDACKDLFFTFVCLLPLSQTSLDTREAFVNGGCNVKTPLDGRLRLWILSQLVSQLIFISL